jgi:hypothetical protein
VSGLEKKLNRSLEGGCAACYGMAMMQPLHGSSAPFSQEDEDTIELELTAEQLAVLSRAAAASETNPAPVKAQDELLPQLLPRIAASAPLVRAPAEGSRDVRATWAVGIAIGAVLFGGVSYFSTTRARPLGGADAPMAHTVARPAAPASAPNWVADEVPVRFTNPFDATEIFEFPAGTSEADARDAVAETLLQRARERGAASPKLAPRDSGPPDPVAPVTPASLARRT